MIIGELRRGFLFASEAGLQPGGLDLTLGIITFSWNYVECSLLVGDQTQVTRAFHNRRASTIQCVRAFKIIMSMIKI